MHQRQQAQSNNKNHSPRAYVDKSDWVETTTVKPRERPRAGKHLSVPRQPMQSGLCRSDQSIHTSSQSSTASVNLRDNSSPFGDDFSQYNLNSRSVAGGGVRLPSQQVSNTQHSKQPVTLGFEDSFADLLNERTNSSTDQVSACLVFSWWI